MIFQLSHLIQSNVELFVSFSPLVMYIHISLQKY